MRDSKRVGFSRPTILIVEDEPSVRESFAAILGDDYNLEMAESGEEALEELCKRRDIHMVFLDYKLPGMSGLEVLRSMQQWSILVPVVMVTGRGTRDIAAQAFQYEVQDYVTKPFRVKDIREAVERVLERSVQGRAPFLSAKKLIDTWIDLKVSTLKIAASVGIGHRELVRQFRAETGMAIVEFRNTKRIEHAKRYLREKDWSIGEIARLVGFKRQNYFTYVFRKIVGITPTVYRRIYR